MTTEELEVDLKKKQNNDSDDLINLNETTTESDKTTQLEDPQQLELKDKEFNIDEYSGFPMDKWVRYQGTINDNRQKRRVSIAGLNKFTMRYNKSDDDDLPEWDTMTLEYHPITVKAWQKRQADNALVEDKQREIGTIELQLSEMQSSIRERALNASKGLSYSKSLSSQSLEDLQKNISTLQNLQKNLKQAFQETKNAAERYAFKIYFHNQDVFNKVRADDLDDIIGACDWKQVNGPANLKPSKNSPTSSQPGVI